MRVESYFEACSGCWLWPRLGSTLCGVGSPNFATIAEGSFLSRRLGLARDGMCPLAQSRKVARGSDATTGLESRACFLHLAFAALVAFADRQTGRGGGRTWSIRPDWNSCPGSDYSARRGTTNGQSDATNGCPIGKVGVVTVIRGGGLELYVEFPISRSMLEILAMAGVHAPPAASTERVVRGGF
jgi:hypothetical protein